MFKQPAGKKAEQPRSLCDLTLSVVKIGNDAAQHARRSSNPYLYKWQIRPQGKGCTRAQTCA